MSHRKQFTIYGHASGPNPWKVKLIFEQLGLDYDVKFLEIKTQENKGPEYLKLNPNGRVPTIIDHKNGDFVLWESGAIIEYLIALYDKDNKISYPAGSKEDWQTKQWLYFQVSGQGPYFGQSAWFKAFHPEKVHSAITRYEEQTTRVLGVINDHLKATGQKYLVGDKLTYADISFVTWDLGLDYLTGSADWREKYPLFTAWHESIISRPEIKKILDWKNSLSQH